jgi:pyridoxamine 5'-phosphate oxidase
LPSPSHQWRRDFPEDLAGKADDIDWEAERINCFNGLSSFLRASFARPAPGSELSDPELAKKWPNELPKIGEEENEKQKELVQQAFQNFAVLYLEVDEVDFVDLGVVPNERHLFRREANDWVKTMLVP